MSRTRMSVAAAVVLVALAAGLYAARRHAGGAQAERPEGDSTWEVTLTARGQLPAKETALTTAAPPDFRRQHIFDEQWDSAELAPPTARGGSDKRGETTWRRRALADAPTPYRLTYTFHVVLGARRPTAAMREHTRALDAPPAPETDGTLRPTARVESDQPEIVEHGKWLAGGSTGSIDQVRAIHEHVANLPYRADDGDGGALDCLRAGGGDAAAKSRLFVALCRSRAIPARIVAGLVLNPDSQPTLHHWAEAWAHAPDGPEGHWLPSCPTYGHFGARRLPANYLVLRLNDEPVVRASGKPQVSFFARSLSSRGAAEPSSAGAFWRFTSFAALAPAEQNLVKFLLLLPLAALVVALFRVVGGLPTFGMFTPALLGLIFRDPRALPWGLGIFVLTVLVGWGLRKLLDRFHLLLIPRAAALLTLIVMFLVAVLLAASHLGVRVTNYVALFPLIILTHMVERFWTVEAEDGTGASFKTLLGTVVVAAATGLALSPDAVGHWVFRNPETLLTVVAAFLLLGRYTGYRVSELYRFRDLIEFEKTADAPPPQGGSAETRGPAAKPEEVGV